MVYCNLINFFKKETTEKLFFPWFTNKQKNKYNLNKLELILDIGCKIST